MNREEHELKRISVNNKRVIRWKSVFPVAKSFKAKVKGEVFSSKEENGDVWEPHIDVPTMEEQWVELWRCEGK